MKESKRHTMLRVSFARPSTARAALKVFEAYGYSARQVGSDVVTDCPALLAVPAIQKRVGLAEIERFDLKGGSDSLDSLAELASATDRTTAAPRVELTA
jgi:hypothetical protein